MEGLNLAGGGETPPNAATPFKLAKNISLDEIRADEDAVKIKKNQSTDRPFDFAEAPFIALNAKLTGLLGHADDSGLKMTLSSLLVIAYVHTAQRAGHACTSSRGRMAVELGMNSSRLSSTFTSLVDAKVIALRDDGSAAVDEREVARMLGVECGKTNNPRLVEGEFFRIPLWATFCPALTGTDALLVGHLMSQHHLLKPNEALSDRDLSEKLGVSQSSIKRSRKNLVGLGIVVAKNATDRKKPVELIFSDKAAEFAAAQDDARLNALKDSETNE